MSASGEIKLNGDMPQLLKIIMLLIDRVAFPTLAFLVIAGIAWFGLAANTKALQDVSNVLTRIDQSTGKFQLKVESDHECFKKDLDVIKTYSYGYQDYIHGRRQEITR